MRRLGYLLFLLGICSFAFSGVLYLQRLNPSRLSFDITFAQQKHIPRYTYPPKRIIISKIAVDLPVIPAKITKGEWETTRKGVSYLSLSPIPGEVGNSVLYGHNFDNLFGSLPKLTPGDTIEIEYADHSKKTFVIHYTQIVTPKQIDIVKPTQDRRITLYTCTGFLDSQRFVVVAMPKV